LIGACDGIFGGFAMENWRWKEKEKRFKHRGFVYL